ncbi:MAG TPA: TolC family protein [Bacteroidia bacterium]
MINKTKSLYIAFVFIMGLPSYGQRVWTLRACVDTAFKKNVALNQGIIISEINKYTLSQSKAAVLPNLNLTDNPNFTKGYAIDPYTYQYTTQNLQVNNLSLNSTVTLFNGYLLMNTIKQNRLVYDASVENTEKLKNDLRLNVLGAYMQVLMDYDAIDVAQSQVEEDSIQIEQTKKFVEFGKVAELNLFQIQSQLASDKLAKVNAENQLQLDKLTLFQFMEIPVKSDFEIERIPIKELFPEIPIPTDEIQKIAENIMPQIKSASLSTYAAIYSLKMAKSGWYPKLTMTGYLKTGYSSLRSNITEKINYETQTIGYLNGNPAQPVIGQIPVTSINSQKESFQDQFKNNFSQAVGFSLTVPIFNNLQVACSVAVAKANIKNAKLNELQTRNDLRKSIETAYTNQVSSGKKLIATQEQMALEKKTYHDMEKKFAFGAIDATSFLVEKNNYNKVSMSLIQAKYDYVLKAKIVDFYLGKPIIN